MFTAPPFAAVEALASPQLLAAVTSDVGLSLAAVIVLGVGAQWLASRLAVPSILLLLLVGVLSGPDVSGLVDTDEMLGDLLFPAVSLAVGILLFEGGLGLRAHEVERHGGVPIIRLVTVGALVTAAVGALGARYVVGFDTDAALLLGAILMVSGPTVMTPLLRFARVREPVNGILRWEGIIIDPIGATVALVVLEAMVADDRAWSMVARVVTTAGAGVAAGLVGAALLALVFDRHWVPDELHNPFTLAVLAAAFAGANLVRPESGLFAATAMGVALANQSRVSMAHIREFEEDLGTLIIAGLFVVLGARVHLDLLAEWAPRALGLLAVLVLVARPVTVWISTVGGGLSRRERLYLCAMAPRGIVAAAVSALFALQLARQDRSIDALVPVTFTVIVGTVVIYGLAARPIARRLHVARPDPRGVAFIGGPRWALELGEVLTSRDVPVLVVTRDPFEAAEAAARGLLTYTHRIDADDLRLALESVGVAVAVAASRVQELNAYGVNRVIGTVGRANVYYLPPYESGEQGEVDEASRHPFAEDVTQASMNSALAGGGRIVAIETADLDPDAGPPEGATLLFTVSASGRPSIVTAGRSPSPPPGGTCIYLLPRLVPGPQDVAAAGVRTDAGDGERRRRRRR